VRKNLSRPNLGLKLQHYLPNPSLALVTGLCLVLMSGVRMHARAPQESGGAMDTQTLHVLVGKSLVVNLESRLMRVMVSNPAVIAAIPTSPTQVVVSAKTVGASSLILWDETGRSRMLDVLVDLDITGLRDSIQLAYPNESIQVQAEGDKLILSGAVTGQDVIDSVVKMSGNFSKTAVNSMVLAEPPHERQILMQVKFAELDRSKVDQFGINIISTGLFNTPGGIGTQQFGALNGGSITPGAAGTSGGGGGSQGRTEIGGQIPGKVSGTSSSFSLTDMLNVFLFRPDLNLGATIKALQQNSVLQILAEPNILALDGKAARFLAGGEFPFPVVQGGTNFSAVTIQFRPFGVRLDFTGYITKENTVKMQIAPEVSTLDYTNAVTISGFTVPAISSRRAETEIEIRDGQTFGIAGLLDQRTRTNMSRVAGIGSLPIIGYLFRSHDVNRSNTELVVLVTPRIVDPVRNGGAAPELPKFPLRSLDSADFDKNLPKSQKNPATAPPAGSNPGGSGKPQ
jgi:pilus assembly protein CpaC